MNRGKPTAGSATAVTAVVILLLVVVFAVRGAVHSGSSGSAVRSSTSTSTAAGNAGSGSVAESALDAQERHTLAEVRSGPPYDYPRNDGVTYHNNNGALPRETDGWYREFTVQTPGESDRGPRRIIAGRDGALFLTLDHYDTFRRIRTGA